MSQRLIVQWPGPHKMTPQPLTYAGGSRNKLVSSAGECMSTRYVGERSLSCLSLHLHLLLKEASSKFL